ncbi:MAG: alpha/beta fold hydrolase [Nannocystaceae bacterium]
MHRPDGALVHGYLSEAPEACRDAIPLLVLDGIGCYGWAFPEITPELAATRPVLHAHYRGHGPSPTPPRPWDLRMETLAHDAMALVEAAGFGGPVVVLGYSMGFQVALECVRHYRDRVGGLINIAGPSGRALATFQGTDAFAHALPVLAGAARFARRMTDDVWRALVPHRIAREIGLVTAVNGRRLASSYLERYMEDLSRIHPELFLSMLEEANAHDGAGLLPSIDIPAQVIAGARDSFVPLEVLRRTAAQLPDASLDIIDDATHAVTAEYIPEVTGFILNLLARVDARVDGHAA